MSSWACSTKTGQRPVVSGSQPKTFPAAVAAAPAGIHIGYSSCFGCSHRIGCCTGYCTDCCTGCCTGCCTDPGIPGIPGFGPGILGFGLGIPGCTGYIGPGSSDTDCTGPEERTSGTWRCIRR